MAKIPQDWLPLFLEFVKYMRINSKEVPAVDKFGAPLDFWVSQDTALKCIVKGMEQGAHTFMFGKARQQGISTIFEALDIFWLATHDGMMGAYVIDKEKNLPAIRDKIRRYFESFPPGFFGKRFKIENDNKDFMLFSNNSRLDFLTAGIGKKQSYWGEGKGYAFVHLCMAKGTPVVLEHGRVKAIEDVRVGDNVLTHTGAKATVVDAVGQPNTKGPMIKISPWLGHSVLCTDEHKFPTQRGLVRADELLKSDFLIMPIRRITNSSPVFELMSARAERGNNQGPAGAGSGKKIILDREFGFAIGYYLAEGCMLHNSYDGRACAITFARHRTEVRYANRAIAALRPFTTESRNTENRKDSLTSTDSIYGTPLCQWVEATFGSKDGKIIPDDVFGWGDEFCEGLLTGLLCGDGSKTEASAGHNKVRTHRETQSAKGKKIGAPRKGISNPDKRYVLNTVVLPSTRSSIALQARDIAASLGYGWASLKYLPAGDRYGRMCKPCWRVTWNGSAAQGLRSLMGLPAISRAGRNHTQKYRIFGDQIYLKIRKIEKGFEEETMWDLSVDHEDHTFRTPYMSTSNTEVAKYGNSAGLASFRSTLSETNPQRLYIYESTSNGINHWKEMWDEFGRDKFGKRRLFIGWWGNDFNRIEKNDARYKVYGVGDLDPEEQELIEQVKADYGYQVTREQLAWYRYQHSDTTRTQEDLNQNLPWTIEQSFVATGYSFFRTDLLGPKLEECRSIPYVGYKYLMGNDFWAVVCEHIYDPNRKEEIVLRVWEEPDPDGMYAIGCDSGWGRGENKDRHAIQVFRCFGDKIVQVAEYADNAIDTRQAAWVLAHLAGAYRNCVVNVELGGPGGVIMTELENLKDKMRIDPRFDVETGKNENWDNFLDNARWYLYKKPDHWAPGMVKGWESTSKTKLQIMHLTRDKFITDCLVLRSAPLIEEMMMVIQNGDSIEAPSPAHDDRVIALALVIRTWSDSLMMSLLNQGDLYEHYVAEQNGVPLDKTTKILNNIVRDYFKAAEQRADEPRIPPGEQWLYDKGFK